MFLFSRASFLSWIFALVAFVLLSCLPWLTLGFIGFLTRFWPLLIAATHLLFANGIRRDAEQRQLEGRPIFLDSLTWVLGVLVFGLLAVALYWAIHYSRLRAD